MSALEHIQAFHNGFEKFAGPFNEGNNNNKKSENEQHTFGIKWLIPENQNINLNMDTLIFWDELIDPKFI